MGRGLSECCVCYGAAEGVNLHACTHTVCSRCTVLTVRHGRHHSCPMCRAPLRIDYTMAVTTVGGVGVLLDDHGRGIMIRDGGVTHFRGCTSPGRLHRQIGTHRATLARMSGETILYGVVATTEPRFLDCIFAVPITSEESRRGRRLRRRLVGDALVATTINGDTAPLQQLMRTLVFPVMLIDVIDPPELETVEPDYP